MGTVHYSKNFAQNIWSPNESRGGEERRQTDVGKETRYSFGMRTIFLSALKKIQAETLIYLYYQVTTNNLSFYRHLVQNV